jgi:hypothetical protein
VSTFGGDTILRVPKGTGDDRALILETSRKIADAYIRFEHLPDAERRTAIERELAIALSVKWEEHNKWVISVGRELGRIDHQNELNKSALLRHGSRYWAELHLYALRVDSQVLPARDLRYWLDFWIAGLPFDGCPCEQHLFEYISENPPSYADFFAWGVNLHNAVNERIGKPVIAVEDARKLWQTRTF